MQWFILTHNICICVKIKSVEIRHVCPISNKIQWGVETPAFLNKAIVHRNRLSSHKQRIYVPDGIEQSK